MNNKILLVFAMTFLLIGLVSAGVEFVEDGGEYGKYIIDTWVPDWLGGKGTSEIKLIQNTGQCLIDCSFTLEGVNEQPVNLIDDVKFVNRNGEDVSDNLKEITFYLGKYEEVEKLNYPKPIYSTEEVCVESNLNETNSSNFTENCYYPVVDYETYNVDELVWTEYNGEKVGGYFQLKAEAKKEKISMDWIVEFRGKELNEWEWWNNDWLYKRQINLTANVGNFSYMNISYYPNMNSDFSDIRFLDLTETTEFNYTIQTKSDGNWAVFRINNKGENNFYMYYGNGEASSTSSASNTYFNPKALYYLDGNINEEINNYGGTNSGTVFTDFIINEGGDFTPNGDGTDKITTGYKPPQGSKFTIGLFLKPRSPNGAITGSYSSVSHSRDGLTIRVNGDGDGISAGIESNSAGESRVNYLAGSSMLNKYYYLTFLYDNNNISLYLNGSLVGTQSTSYTNLLHDENLMIGNDRTSGGGLGSSLDGLIDEYYIYEKILTQDQITQLSTQTAPTYTIGEEQFYKGFITIDYVTPPTPENNSNLSVNYIPVEVEINYTNATLDNITYDFYKGGELNQSYFFTNETLFVNHTGCQCDNWAFNVTACYTEQLSGTSNCTTTETRYLIIDSQPPVINITSPLTTYDYLYDNYTLDLNWTVEDEAEHLDSCWYEYNGTNNSVTCNDNTTTFNYIPNVNNLTFYANDTFWNVGSELRSWSVRVLELNRTISSEVIETETQNATIFIKSLEDLEANLDYGGNIYTATKSIIGDNIYKFNTQFDTPIITADENKSIYWNISNGVSINTYNSTQEVKNLILNYSQTYPLMNITIYDEITENIINDTELTLNSDYYIGSGTTNESIYSELIRNGNYSIGTNLETSLFTINDFTYKASGYQPRKYINNFILVNGSITQLSLYLLSNVDGTIQLFNIYEKTNLDSLSGVKLTSYELVGGNPVFRDSTLSDDSGNANLWLNPDELHQIVVTKTGCVSKTISIYPTGVSVQDIELDCGGEIEGPTYNSTEFFKQYNLTASFNPNIREIPYNSSNTTEQIQTFSVNYEDSSCTMTGAELRLINLETGDILGTNTSINCEDTLTITHNITGIDKVKSLLIITKSGADPSYSIIYDLIDINDLAYSGTSISRIISKLTDISDFGLSQNTKTFLAFLIIFLIIGSLSLEGIIKSEGYGLYLLLLGLIFIFSIIGWLYLDLPVTMVNEATQEVINQWAIMLLSSVAIGGIVLSQSSD